MVIAACERDYVCESSSGGALWTSVCVAYSGCLRTVASGLCTLTTPYGNPFAKLPPVYVTVLCTAPPPQPHQGARTTIVVRCSSGPWCFAELRCIIFSYPCIESKLQPVITILETRMLLFHNTNKAHLPILGFSLVECLSASILELQDFLSRKNNTLGVYLLSRHLQLIDA